MLDWYGIVLDEHRFFSREGCSGYVSVELITIGKQGVPVFFHHVNGKMSRLETSGPIDARTATKHIRNWLDVLHGVKMSNEQIRPDYYGGADNVYEVRKVIQEWNLPWELGDVVKYVARAGKKNPAEEMVDLIKARTYLNFRLEKLQRAGQKRATVDEGDQKGAPL